MIKINNIIKKYDKLIVLENINLSLKKGQIYALLGKNGAGKTTLINLSIDLIELDSGSIEILGKSNKELDKSDKKRIGVLTDTLDLIEEINGYEFLSLVGRIYQIPKNTLKSRIGDLFQYFFEDTTDLKKNISKYSTGMKKKLAFCAAVIHTPEILILDEPFSALDPLVANQMILFLKKYQNGNRVFFISSHDLSYVEKIATHIGVLDNKTLIFNSTIQDFTENGSKTLDSALLNIIKPNENELNKIDWI